MIKKRLTVSKQIDKLLIWEGRRPPGVLGLRSIALFLLY
jgi:hypothetical protein